MRRHGVERGTRAVDRLPECDVALGDLLKNAVTYRSVAALVALAVALGTLGVLLPDKVQANNGLGADGALYGQMVLTAVQRGSFWSGTGQFNSYSFQRILPS